METWQNPTTIAIWISIGIIVVFLLAVSIVFLVRANVQRYTKAKTTESELKLNHQQELVEVSIETQEQERSRIAADLHDGLIGKLTAIRLKNQLGNHAMELDSVIEESISLTRQISHDLAPPLIEHTRLVDIIAEVLEPWTHRYELSFKTDIQQNDCSTEVKLQLLRSAQEIMSNINKHAQAKKVQVHLLHNTRRVSLRIADDGIGFSKEQKFKGLGLENIQVRMQSLNGYAHIHSVPQRGTSFLLTIPLTDT